MNRYFYADSENKPRGPFTLAELSQLASTGVISNSTNVILEGADTWIKWERVQTSESSAEIAQAVIAKASQMGENLKTFDWSGFFFGLFLVVVEYFVLPYALLRRAAADLSAWGRRRILPTATSDLPVLTFLTVVTRPAAHVLWTAYYGFKAVKFLVDGKVTMSFFGLFSSYQQVEFPDRLYYFIGMCLSAYFANFLIGLVFDALSLLVTMANSLKKIERK